MKILTVAVIALLAAAILAGCASSGSREFVPGSGWVPN
jgi:uncharacterized lipoprotein YbaY